MSGGQNCVRPSASFGDWVRPPPPPLRQSSTPMYYCERKQNVKTGEAWEQG